MVPLSCCSAAAVGRNWGDWLTWTSLVGARWMHKVGDKSLTAKEGSLTRTMKSSFSDLCIKYDDTRNVDRMAAVQVSRVSVSLYLSSQYYTSVSRPYGTHTFVSSGRPPFGIETSLCDPAYKPRLAEKSDSEGMWMLYEGRARYHVRSFVAKLFAGRIGFSFRECPLSKLTDPKLSPAWWLDGFTF